MVWDQCGFGATAPKWWKGKIETNGHRKVACLDAKQQAKSIWAMEAIKERGMDLICKIY
jgi:hypothetical protein